MTSKSLRRTAFLCSTSALVIAALSAPAAFAQAVATNPQGAAPEAPAAAPDASSTVNEVIVIGSTSKRTLLNASVAVTAVNRAELDQKAPRSTADVLETVPGIYVEGTAGPVSNNYSVRGLPGGGQDFIRLTEDGMPTIYGGLNDDEVFQFDLSIDRVEAVEGGTSGILTPNAAGASINFVSRPLNFDEAGGLARITGASYGEERGDLWYSAPIKGTILGDNVAFAVSGYIDSTKGVRSSPFDYKTYHFKAQLEKKFDSGGYVRLTYKRWDEHDPYYADQPYADVNGKIGGVPGLNSQSGNILGSSFASIAMPDSCKAGECYRNFNGSQGIHATGNEYRIDAEKPINDSLSVFAKVRYTQTDWEFNGVFAGSGSGNSGLASAVDYLNPAVSPISSLLAQGSAAFPNATQFGIKDLRTGQIIPASNVSALNALNGNGLLQQTVLNWGITKLRDWGSDFGARWKAQGDFWSNNLTVGGMVYSQNAYNDQAVSTVINDVKNNSDIYDVVALNSSDQVVGTLSNNGQISYGDWGTGLSHSHMESQSVYLNDEATFFNRLHLDFGLRYEHEKTDSYAGQGSLELAPAGTGGLIPGNPNAFNGTFQHTSGSESPVSWTIGANYTINPSLSVYARYADAYKTNGTNAKAVGLKLYEAGVTYSGYGFLGTIRGFRTEFDNQSWPAGNYTPNPNYSVALFGNSITNGFDVDATYRPTYQPLHAFSVHGQLTYQDSTLSGVSVGFTDNQTGAQIIDPTASAQTASYYEGHRTQHTPGLMYQFTPQYDLPDHRGNVYVRYKYIGQVFADAGNGLILPGYGVVSVGGTYDITPRLNLNVSVDNVNDTVGLTEGNPRQGLTQAVVNGYFYGRGIVGTNAMAQLTFKF